MLLFSSASQIKLLVLVNKATNIIRISQDIRSAAKWGKTSGLRGLTNREPFKRLRSAENVKENQMSSLNRVPAATVRI